MTTLDAIARPSGGFAMVAMDQRESLRTMFADAGCGRVGDDTLVGFKTAVAHALGPHASGFLTDRHYGFDRVRTGVLPAGCGLILAADALSDTTPAAGVFRDVTARSLPTVADPAACGCELAHSRV